MARYRKRRTFALIVESSAVYSEAELCRHLEEAVMRYNMLHRLGLENQSVKVIWPARYTKHVLERMGT